MKREMMLGVPKDSADYVELAEHRAMMELPENSVEVTMHAKVYDEGGIINVTKTYNMQEIHTMFKKADDGYIDDDDVFVITEKGKKWLEEMEQHG